MSMPWFDGQIVINSTPNWLVNMYVTSIEAVTSLSSTRVELYPPSSSSPINSGWRFSSCGLTMAPPTRTRMSPFCSPGATSAIAAIGAPTSVEATTACRILECMYELPSW
jgi:hypothetical protein